MLSTWYGPAGTRFSLILGIRIGPLKHLEKTWLNAWNASLVVCLHGYVIACALKEIFAQCKIFLEETLPAKHVHHLRGWRTLGWNIAIEQGWAISGSRATCGPPQRFQWPAEAFRNNHQVWNFLEFITVNVSVQANLNRDLILFYYSSISQPEIARFVCGAQRFQCNDMFNLSCLF